MSWYGRTRQQICEMVKQIKISDVIHSLITDQVKIGGMDSFDVIPRS